MDIVTELEVLEELNRDYEDTEKNFHKWVNKHEKLLNHLTDLEDARVIIQKAAKITQRQISTRISKIVTMALSAVFGDDAYEFKAEFVTRRNVTECDLLFYKDGKSRKPLNSCGYGAADVASLALRVAFWKLDGETRPTLILDEPTRNLDKSKQPLASMMIKKLSDMGIQFVIVTHRQELAEAADKVFLTTKEKGISYVKEVSK